MILCLFIVALLIAPVVSIHPSSVKAQNAGATLTATVTVDGRIQTDDPWTTGSRGCNEWAKPMYYIWFDDNGNPADGRYDNGHGPMSAQVNLDTGRLGFRSFGPDRQWGSDDDVVYWPIAETSPGKWSAYGIEASTAADGKSLTVTFPLNLMGNPNTLEVSFMASAWTTTALDNLGPGAYSVPAWIAIDDATTTESYPQIDSKGDTDSWPSCLAQDEAANAANFDIVEATVSIRAISPATPTVSPTNGMGCGKSGNSLPRESFDISPFLLGVGWIALLLVRQWKPDRR